MTANGGGIISDSSSVIVGVASPEAGVDVDSVVYEPNAFGNNAAVVRKTKTLSHCNCQLDNFDGQFLLCRYAKQWVRLIEDRTD